VSDVITIAGSPSQSSRSTAVLAYTRTLLQNYGLTTDAIHVRDLDAEDLLTARFDSPTIRNSIERVQQARAVVIATPIYKATYSGVLKVFLDLLPQDGLNNKIVLPIATGGSPAHLLAIDYARKPVLSALGAQHILSGIYIQNAQIQQVNGNGFALDAAVEKRLQHALATLAKQLITSEPVAVTQLVAVF